MSPPSTPSLRTRRRTGRRTVLDRRGALTALGGGVLLLAGCSGPAPDDRSRPPGRTGRTRQSEAARDEQDPDDAALVERVREELGSVAALLVSTRRAAPGLRADLLPLLRLHEAHAAALGAALEDPGETDAERVPGAGRRDRDAGTLLDLVRAREVRLQADLVEHAVSASSGALARLLASMSAGLAQRLVVLPGSPSGSSGGSS